MLKMSKEDFRFGTDEESLAYLVEVVELMMTRFGIKKAEAVLRINRSFSHVEAVTGEDDIIYSEFPIYWANYFYYGKESYWWLDPAQRTEMNLPKLRPIDCGKINEA